MITYLTKENLIELAREIFFLTYENACHIIYYSPNVKLLSTFGNPSGLDDSMVVEFNLWTDMETFYELGSIKEYCKFLPSMNIRLTSKNNKYVLSDKRYDFKDINNIIKILISLYLLTDNIQKDADFLCQVFGTRVANMESRWT